MTIISTSQQNVADDKTTVKKKKEMKMKVPFINLEVKKTLKLLKNEKGAGIDDLNGELLKCGPYVICQHIADIFNQSH